MQVSGTDSLFAEHVFEHLTPTQVKCFLWQSTQFSTKTQAIVKDFRFQLRLTNSKLLDQILLLMKTANIKGDNIEVNIKGDNIEVTI